MSWSGGFSIDDWYERETAEANFQAIQDFVDGDDRSFGNLLAHRDRYYGVGFHALAYPARLAIAPLFERYQSLAPRDALLAAEHVISLLFFLFGGWCFYRILRLAGVERELAALSTLFFLANPYLLGHAAFNIKDAPFMVAWLLCTWRMLVPIRRLARENSVRVADFVWLGAATALLFSIRISGVLIGFQYLLAVAATFAFFPARVREQAQAIARGMGAVVAVSLLLTWLAYPVFWLAPWRIVEAIRFMGQHPWNSCSMTWGSCLPAHDLPWTYVPAWLAVKVSIVALLGFALAAFRICRPSTDKFERLALTLLVLSPVLMILALVAAQVRLYNEIRQVLFIVPLIYLAACIALAQRATLARALLYGGLAIFAIDHARAHPYQYAWFNEAARFLDVDRQFETDYWALSSKELSAELRRTELARTACVFVPTPHQYQPWLSNSGIACLKNSFYLRDGEPRPFLLTRIPHTGAQGYGTAPDCVDLYTVERTLFPSPKAITMGRLQLCPATPASAALDEVTRLVNQSLALINGKRYREAIEVCERGLLRKPEDGVLMNNLATAHLLLDEIGKGERILTRLVEINPDFELARNNLGWARSLSGDVEKRILAQRQALESATDAPSRIPILWDLAWAYSALDEQAQALSMYEAIRTLDPRHVAAINNAGVALMALGRYDQAIERFHEAARLAPAEPLYRNNVQWALDAIRGGK